jgi:hypothetical protein
VHSQLLGLFLKDAACIVLSREVVAHLPCLIVSFEKSKFLNGTKFTSNAEMCMGS